MQRLPGERVLITVDDVSIEVERLAAWPLYYLAVGRMGAYLAAETPEAELAALRELYGFFVAEAQPTWDLADHRGPLPPSVEGMYRLPMDLSLGFIDGWTDTFIPKSTAVDEIVPPGPVRDELNKRLKKAAKDPRQQPDAD